MNKIAAISLRVNPNVDAKTHPYISTGLKQTNSAWLTPKPWRYTAGRATCSICASPAWIATSDRSSRNQPFIAAAEKILLLVDALAAEGIRLEHLDLGGGLGICYNDGNAPAIADYVAELLVALHGRSEKLILEPGRVLVGNAGVLLTRVEYLSMARKKTLPSWMRR